MKKGFATSAILYTMLLLFIILLVGILNNLQNKKTILDALKKDTVFALNQDSVLDSLLDEISLINTKFMELENRILNFEQNTYTKEEIDTLLHEGRLKVTIINTQEELDTKLNKIEAYSEDSCTKEILSLNINSDYPYMRGGSWVLETCKLSTKHAYQIARKYDSYGIRTFSRSLNNSVWTTWRDIDVYSNFSVDYVTNQSELDAKLNNIESYPSNSCTKKTLIVSVTGLTLEGGNWILETCKADNRFGFQVAKKYGTTGVMTYERNLFESQWGSWIVR